MTTEWPSDTERAVRRAALAVLLATLWAGVWTMCALRDARDGWRGRFR